MSCTDCTEFLVQGSGTVGAGTAFSYEKVVIAEDPDNIPLVLLSVKALDKDDVLLADQTPAWLEATTSGQSVLVGSRLVYRLTVTVEIDATRILDPGSGDPAEWGEGTYTIELRAQVEDGSKPVIVCLFDVCISGTVVGDGLLYFFARDVSTLNVYVLSLDLENITDGYTIWGSLPDNSHANGIGSIYGIDEANALAYFLPASGVVDSVFTVAEGATIGTEFDMGTARDQTGVDANSDAEQVLVMSFNGNDNVHVLDPVTLTEDCLINHSELGFASRAYHDKARDVITWFIAAGADQGIFKATGACAAITTVEAFGFGATVIPASLNGWFPRLGFTFFVLDDTSGNNQGINISSYLDILEAPISNKFVSLEDDGRLAAGITIVDIAFNDKDEAIYYTTDNGDATFSIWRKAYADWFADPDRDDYTAGVKSYEVEVLPDCFNASLVPSPIDPAIIARPRISLGDSDG